MVSAHVTETPGPQAVLSGGASALQAGAGGEACVRPATPADVPAMLHLIDVNLAAGHLLPRTHEDLTRHATRFTVVTIDGRVVGCAELAPLSRAVAEVRSLVVDETCRGRGIGSELVEELSVRARRDGFSTLCAFTHHPSHFVRLGFSIVPHPWLPEKISTDCYGCPKFRACGQFAMVFSLNGDSVRTSPAGQRPYQALPPAAESAAARRSSEVRAQ